MVARSWKKLVHMMCVFMDIGRIGEAADISNHWYTAGITPPGEWHNNSHISPGEQFLQ